MTQSAQQSEGPEQTISMARKWAKDLKPGTVVGLMGPLGAGKTCFAKGVISQLTGTPITEITSPTFTLVEEYEGDPRIYHVDLYRLENSEQLEALPVEDWFDPDVITLIEWPENSPELPQDCKYLVKFTKGGETKRQMEYQKRIT